MSISKETLEHIFKNQEPNLVFVETGSFLGDGIQKALDVGFKEVHSIEYGEQLYKGCLKRFESNENVFLYHGDSGKILYDVCKNITDPIVFWLDGHYSEGITARSNKNCPLYEELDQICQLKENNHTILIDDVRDFGKTMEVTMQEILVKLVKINNKYSISYLDGYVPNDILMAKCVN